MGFGTSVPLRFAHRLLVRGAFRLTLFLSLLQMRVQLRRGKFRGSVPKSTRGLTAVIKLPRTPHSRQFRYLGCQMHRLVAQRCEVDVAAFNCVGAR